MACGTVVLDERTRISTLLEVFPHTREVLNRYGLHGCGGTKGPAESLQFFARAHGVDEAELLDELRRSISGRRPARLPFTDARVDDAIYRRYFTSGIAVTLTAGATWGAYMLYRIGLAHDFKGVSIFQINAHGHAQIFGWVGLFIMGFAYQAFPRKWQTRLVAPNLAVATFIAMLIGLSLKTVGLAAPQTAWGARLALAGGVAEIAAAAVFAWQMIQTFRQSMGRFDPWVGYVMAGTLFFVGQAIFDTWHGWTTMTASSEKDLLWHVATYQAPLRDLQLHGVALLMILGVNQRLLPGIYNLPGVPRRMAWASLGLLIAAILGEMAVFIAYRWTGSHVLAGLLMAPWAMLAAGVAMVAWRWKLWRPLRGLEGEVDRIAKFIRMSYAWLALSLVMLLLLPVYHVASGIPFSHAYYGAIRHAFTVGFISLMIMAFAAKVVPTLNGVDPRSLSRLRGPFLLINTGCFLRVTLQTLTDWSPTAFHFVGISGVLEVTALAWWGLGLIGLMRKGKREVMREHELHADPPPSAVAANHKVAQVLTWFPESQSVFERHGLGQVRNPLLRRTLARRVSLAEAAAMHQVPLPTLLADLNAVAVQDTGRGNCGGHHKCAC